MGVEIMYNPFSKVSIIFIFIFIVSCTPVNNNSDKKILIKNYPTQPPTMSEKDLLDQKLTKKNTDLNKN